MRAAVVVVAAVAALVFGPHVVDGGFYWDDWQLAARNVFPAHSPDYIGGRIDQELLTYRPLLGLLLPSAHALLGPHPWIHITLGLLIGVATSAAFYMLLRALGLRHWHAVAVAVLTLLFPWSDSLRFWSTAALNLFGVIAWMLGTVAAVRGLREGADRRWTWLALGLYLAGVLTYEVAAPAMALSILVYRRLVPWREAVRRWRLDVMVVAAALIWNAINTPRSKEPLLGILEHAYDMTREALVLLARAVVPIDGVPSEPVLVGLAALVVVAVSRKQEPLRPWLLAAGAGALLVACGYALFVPADEHYLPLAPGVVNRINLLAGPGYALLVHALVMLVATLVVPARAAAAGLVVTGVIAMGWAIGDVDSRRDWDRAAALQEDLLAGVRAAVPEPAYGSVLYTFRHPTETAPGVPVFSVSWDLKAAVRLEYRDGSLRGYPIDPRARMGCGTRRAQPVFGNYDKNASAIYGRAIFVDVRRRSAEIIDSAAECRTVAARLLARG